MKWTKVLYTSILGFALLLSGEAPRVEAGPPLPNNLLRNSGFESGPNGQWYEYPSLGSVIGSWGGAYRGSYLAKLNGQGKVSTNEVSQTVVIPSDVVSANLSFYLRISTAESPYTVQAYDTLKVMIHDENASCGHTVCPTNTLVSYSNRDATPDYRYHEFDVTGYKGHTVEVIFLGQEDFSLPTFFLIDNVALTVTPRFQPQPLP